ncbi:D-alanyl-D-alanine carboxypeptidase/D-alanyl-D-alanine-endopeptidase [Candidatus Babeliales bacterium]|nr:D-alanyl-D-alanine carboxypeptidase/D-alanyl-D-alanine-endopeptidase [Candidatus Babeliales bacterium]
MKFNKSFPFKTIFYIAILLCICFCLTATKQNANIEAIIKKFNLESAQYGVCVQDTKTNESILSKDAEKVFLPASGLKLFTTATALEILTPSYRFRTSLYAKAPIYNQNLNSDLVLYGRGDPSLDYEGIKKLAQQLYDAGVKNIIGNIIASDEYFNTPKHPWGWEIGDTDWYYAPEITSLSINKNAFEITIEASNKINKTAKTILYQEIPYYNLVNLVKTVEKGEEKEISADYDPVTNNIYIGGTVSKEQGIVKERISLKNPPKYAGLLLKKALDSYGIKITGNVLVKKHSNEFLQEVAFVESPPLPEIIKQINKISDNLYSELLFNSLGRNSSEIKGTDAEKATLVINKFLQNFEINSNSIKLTDGSGESRWSLISPKQFVSLLTNMKKSPHFKYFYDSLPIAGKDLRPESFKGTRGENKIQAKTGMHTGACSLSGYAETKSGKNIAFSIIINNGIQPSKQIKSAIDKIMLSIIENY